MMKYHSHMQFAVTPRTTMFTEKVTIVNWSRIGKCLKYVHPLTTDIVAIAVVLKCFTWPLVINAFLLAVSNTYCTC